MSTSDKRNSSYFGRYYSSAGLLRNYENENQETSNSRRNFSLPSRPRGNGWNARLWDKLYAGPAQNLQLNGHVATNSRLKTDVLAALKQGKTLSQLNSKLEVLLTNNGQATQNFTPSPPAQKLQIVESYSPVLKPKLNRSFRGGKLKTKRKVVAEKLGGEGGLMKAEPSSYFVPIQQYEGPGRGRYTGYKSMVRMISSRISRPRK